MKMKQNLTKKEFNILVALIENGKMNQRDLADATAISPATANRVLKDLTEKNLVSSGEITANGEKILESHRAKKAVFLAAGIGTRLVPITLNTPKPLIRVNGIRLIDTALDAVLAAGIDDITIVRGYLSEQFDQLLYKYPMIKFLENPADTETNNISSIMCARYGLQNAYIVESDLLVRNPAVIKKYHYCSDFLCCHKKRTDDWCFDVADGVISGEKIGGKNCWQIKGVSYWNAADGKKLAAHLQAAYKSPGGKSLFWEQVPLVKFHDDYRVEICECADSDIAEINTFSELKALDKSYGRR